MAVGLLFLSLKQKDYYEFEVTLDCRMRTCLRKTKPQVNKNKFFLRTTIPQDLSSFLSPLKGQARPDDF